MVKKKWGIEEDYNVCPICKLHTPTIKKYINNCDGFKE